MNYWINSNSGDYITENNGVYKLNLIPRWSKYYSRLTGETGEASDEPYYLPGEVMNIDYAQFKSLKGFIPIKGSKLRTNLYRGNGKIYAPTAKGGGKGVSKRITLPTLAEARDARLKELGL